MELKMRLILFHPGVSFVPRFKSSPNSRRFYIAASSFIEGSCRSPYHGRVFLNSARQIAPAKNLSRG